MLTGDLAQIASTVSAKGPTARASCEAMQSSLIGGYGCQKKRNEQERIHVSVS